MRDKYNGGAWLAHPTGLARSGKPEFEIHWSPYGECIAEIVHGEDEAKLIAAAPQMLEALKAIAQDLRERGDKDSNGVVTVNCGASVWVKLNNAIAKAEGTK